MKRLADQTLYEILEIPPGASAEQIEAAYEKARALYGPGSLVTYTLMEPDEAALLEARIEDARGTLLDPERRARYDASLEERHDEARAVASGSAAPAPIGPPSIIPAAPPPLAPSLDAPPPLVPVRPAILLGAALGAAGPAEDAPAPPPHPGPILLQHAIAEERVSAPADGGAEAVSAPEPAAPSAPPAEPAPAAAATGPAPVATEARPAAATTPAEPPSTAAAMPRPVVPPPIPDVWTGDALRQVREARGLTVQQIADRTKITRHHIENIEGDRFASLPAQVYLRGILLTIARELRLDGQKVARSYIDQLRGAAPASAAPKPR